MSKRNPLAGVFALGLIQGLTEFLPVSSSGHLVVGQRLLALAPASMLLDVVLHMGTLLPVLWLYRADLCDMLLRLPSLAHCRARWAAEPGLRLLVGVAVASVPTAFIGLLAHDLFERLFANTVAVGCAFLVTGAILFLAFWRRRGQSKADQRPDQITVGRALIVGLAQGIAITPGISRSGTTIATGLLVGLERELAARLSFVMSVPAILGATALELRKASAGDQGVGMLLVGAAAAAASGYLALRWVVRAVRRGELHWFAWYLWPLGTAVLVYSLR